MLETETEQINSKNVPEEEKTIDKKSHSSKFEFFYVSRNAMLNCELLTFFTLHDVLQFSLLSKTINQVVDFNKYITSDQIDQ